MTIIVEMVKKSNDRQTEDEPMSDEREARILEAAADLIAHYGFDKTTVSDIANEAGISKGAIYLHFDSKDDLFEALLLREILKYSRDWVRRIEADPDGGTMGGVYRNILYAIEDNPLMSALFRRDRRVLGSYLRKKDNLFQRGQVTAMRAEFVRQMQQAGAVREDVNPLMAAHVMNMLALGLVNMDDITPDDDQPPLKDLIDAMADFMDRAFTPDDGGNSDAGKAIIRQMTEKSREQLRQQQQTRDHETDNKETS
jgi:TetR/AcrR family acrAB operon transcriptional repressor